MTLEIVLSLGKTDLLYQENAQANFKVANTGKDPLKVVPPRDGLTELRLRAVDAKTGVERVLRGPVLDGNALPPMPGPLAPGKSLSAYFPFLQFAAALSPGDYEISAIYSYNEPPVDAESKAVRIKIRPTTPRGLVLEPLGTPVFRGFWVNVAGDAPELVQMKFNTGRSGGAGDLIRLLPVPLQTVPTTSLGPNEGLLAYRWLAWTEDGSAKFLHVDDSGPTPAKTFPLPSPDAAFVSPLYSDLKTSEKERPAGAALVYSPRDAQLVAFKLAVDGAARLAAAPLPGPKPAWIVSVVRADKKRVAVYAQATGDRVSLSEIPWPGASPAAAPRALGDFKGAFMGADGVLGLDDNVFRGSLITRTGVEAHLDLERIDFAIDAAGVFTAQPPVRIPSDPVDPFVKAHVRLGERGAVAALLQSLKGLWSIYDGRQAAALPEPLRRSPYPLDLAFHEGSQPVLLIGAKDLGFRIALPDGRPVPAKQ